MNVVGNVETGKKKKSRLVKLWERRRERGERHLQKFRNGMSRKEKKESE